MPDQTGKHPEETVDLLTVSTVNHATTSLYDMLNTPDAAPKLVNPGNAALKVDFLD